MVGDLRMWLGRDTPATHADAQAAGHPHRAPGPPGRSILSSSDRDGSQHDGRATRARPVLVPNLRERARTRRHQNGPATRHSQLPGGPLFSRSPSGHTRRLNHRAAHQASHCGTQAGAHPGHRARSSRCNRLDQPRKVDWAKRGRTTSCTPFAPSKPSPEDLGPRRGGAQTLKPRPLQAFLVSGASRNRTGDLLLAKQALSQLSYGPERVEFTRGELQPDGHGRGISGSPGRRAIRRRLKHHRA